MTDAQDYQPRHRAEVPTVVGPERPLKHDTIKHVLAGSLGTHVPGCPRCEQQHPTISDRVNGARSSTTHKDES